MTERPWATDFAGPAPGPGSDAGPGSGSGERTGLLVWMILAQCLAVLTLVIWAPVAGLSVMAFDSGETTGAWIFVLSIWAYPLLPLIFSAGAWIAFVKRWNKWAATLVTLAFAPPVVLAILIWGSTVAWDFLHS
ncbi:MAG: hypothetical protein QG671_289 [Actinomycetota bacterium]|nr:hypothetical protein [Actinomycetota bacterium]